MTFLNEKFSLPEPKFYPRIYGDCFPSLCAIMKTIFVVGMSPVNQKIVQLIFSNCFDGLKTTVRIKTCKEENQHHFLL